MKKGYIIKKAIGLALGCSVVGSSLAGCSSAQAHTSSAEVKEQTETQVESDVVTEETRDDRVVALSV